MSGHSRWQEHEAGYTRHRCNTAKQLARGLQTVFQYQVSPAHTTSSSPSQRVAVCGACACAMHRVQASEFAGDKKPPGVVVEVVVMEVKVVVEEVVEMEVEVEVEVQAEVQAEAVVEVIDFCICDGA